MAGTNSEAKLQGLRNFEREHLNDMADTAVRQEQILAELYKPKAERIKKYAETLAERIELNDPMLDIREKTQISTYIRRKYRESGIAESTINNISRELADEYKNKAFEREQVQLGSGLIAEVNGDQMSADIKKPVKQMDNLELQETDDMLREKEARLKAELARVRDIKEEVYGTAAERHYSLEGMKSGVISTPQPGNKDTEFSNELIELGNCIIEVGRKAIQFPPNSQDAIRYAKAVRTYITILRPLTDLKFTKGTREWLNTTRKEDIMGKHGAAVKSSARAAITGEERALTREQVGDKKEQVLEQAIEILNSEYLLEALEDWHDRYVEPYIAQRKVDLHDTLSEKA